MGIPTVMCANLQDSNIRNFPNLLRLYQPKLENFNYFIINIFQSLNLPLICPVIGR